MLPADLCWVSISCIIRSRQCQSRIVFHWSKILVSVDKTIRYFIFFKLHYYFLVLVSGTLVEFNTPPGCCQLTFDEAANRYKKNQKNWEYFRIRDRKTYEWGCDNIIWTNITYILVSEQLSMLVLRDMNVIV